MAYFVPCTADFQNAVKDRTSPRYLKVLIDIDGDDVLEDITSYLFNNTVSGGGKGQGELGVSTKQYTIKLRNSGQWFKEGDFAGAKCAIEAKAGNAEYIRIFTGYVSEEGCIRDKKTLTEDIVTVRMNDASKTKGHRRKTNPVIYVNYKICDTNNTSTSIFHKLASQLGLSDSDLETADIDYIKDYLSLEGKRTVWHELQDLCAQYIGHLTFRYDGKLRFISRHQTGYTDPTSEWTFDGNNIHRWVGKSTKIVCNRVKTEFEKYENLGERIIYKNTDEWNADFEWNDINIEPGEYWPGPNAGDKAKLIYKDPVSGEKFPIGINIQTPTIGSLGSGSDIECEGGLLTLISFNGSTVDTQRNPDSSEIILKNDTAATITIRKFELRGTPLRIQKKITIEDVDSTIINEWDFVDKTIPGKYAVSDSQAHISTQRWVEFGKVKRKIFDIITDWIPQIQEGAVVTFNPDPSLNMSCVIESYTHDCKGSPRKWRTKITLREKEDFSPSGTPKVIEENQAESSTESNDIIQKEITNRPTYNEVATTGFDAGGGTTTPTQVSILKAKGEFKASILKWDKQNNLTNFDKYQIQVSDCGLQSCGLSGLTEDSETGLTASTTYYFKVAINGGTSTEYSITTGTDTTYAAVISLLNSAVSGATFFLMNGDLYCRSDTFGATSSILLDHSTSGTDLFNSLTGFSDFETTENGSGGWYSLKFDMSDWKDSLNSYTDWYTELLVHTVPLRGSTTIGKGRVLGYRVRRYTKSGATGSWSSTAVIIVRTVESGDMAKHIITADLIETSVLNSLIANIREYLQISSDNGYQATTYSNFRAYKAPLLDDKKLYMDRDEIRISKWSGFENWPDFQTPSAETDVTHLRTLSSNQFVQLAAQNKFYINSIDSNGNITFGPEQSHPFTGGKVSDFDVLDSTHIVAIGYEYSAGTYYYKVAVGSISGTTISWGTAVEYMPSSGTQGQDVAIVEAFDTDRALLIYEESGGYIRYAKVIKVSGTTVTLGSRYTVDGRNVGGFGRQDSLEKINTAKLVYAYSGLGYVGYFIRVIEVSGTDRDELTIGDYVQITDGDNDHDCNILSLDGIGKCLFLYLAEVDNDRRSAQRIINVSGTDITVNDRYLSVHSDFLAEGVVVSSTEVIFLVDNFHPDPNSSHWHSAFFACEISGNVISAIYGGGIFNGGLADSSSHVHIYRPITIVGDWIVVSSSVYDTTWHYNFSAFKGDLPSWKTLLLIGGEDDGSPRIYGDGNKVITTAVYAS